jgi:hypothetical protein
MQVGMIWKQRTAIVAANMVAATLAMALAASPLRADPVDLEGVWRIAEPTDDLRPIDGEIPFTESGRAVYERNVMLRQAGEFDEYDITLSRCSSPGVPRLMINAWPFKIWQMFGVVTFDFEWNRSIRQIDTRGHAIEPVMAPRFTGVSTGHWEGDTLVVVTTDISDRTLIDQLIPHGWDLKVTERLRLIDEQTLENRITIEDPEFFTRPWQSVVTYTRQPYALLPEHVCMDSLPHIRRQSQ